MNNHRDIKIVTVEKANDFVGIKIRDKKVEVYIPQVFRIEDFKQDVLHFLRTISIGKNIEKNNLRNGSDSLNEVWPIDSYLWIINDYIGNGYFFNREKQYFNRNDGKIEWKKTLRKIPIFSDGNIIYDKFISSKSSATNDIVAQIYKLCLKQSIERLGWLLKFNFIVDIKQFYSTKEMISVIKKELLSTFDDLKRVRFRHMLKILEGNESDEMISSNYAYGINNYYYVYEVMINLLFKGIHENGEKSYNPKGYWKLIGQTSQRASSLRPDTIIIKNNTTYILDAKFYRYGTTHRIEDLPQTESMQKQITYGDYIFNVIGDKNVRNAFVLPFNKELEVFKKDEHIERFNESSLIYLGYAHVDWRDNEKKFNHDFIHTFAIDFNYLLNNYKNGDDRTISELCNKIDIELSKLSIEIC